MSTMTLSPTEQTALATLARQLYRQLPHEEAELWLFGSKARGEARPDSDIDVLIVVNSTDWRVHKQVRYVVADINLEFDTEISACVWSRAKWQSMATLPTTFYEQVRHDGVRVTPWLEFGPVATVAEAMEILKQTREPVEPDPGLTAELRQRFEQKMGLL